MSGFLAVWGSSLGIEPSAKDKVLSKAAEAHTANEFSFHVTDVSGGEVISVGRRLCQLRS